jgi:hypothetical protein
VCYNRGKLVREGRCMHDRLRHLPFAIVLFIILFTAVADLAVGAGVNVLATVLAPTLWLGLYLLGSDRVGEKE